jgi:NADH-quinone oxidoreductase subunit C/D
MTAPAALPEIRPATGDVLTALTSRFGEGAHIVQETADGTPTAWVAADRTREVLGFLKSGVDRPYEMLYDLTVVDERARVHRQGLPASDFTVVYELTSLDRNADVRIKTPLTGEFPSLPTITDLWPNADWYEREAWDLFGVTFTGHPRLRRLLLPPTWEGHPLRKDQPARATEREPFSLPDAKWIAEEEASRFKPEEWGMATSRADADYLFLNLGPQHLGTHGVLRVVLQIDGERVVDCVPDIGYHHRGAEKMAERQTWHTYIPYTDRIDYLAGAMNNLPYVLAVEKLAGIDVPDRARVVRVLLAELFRIASHLIWYGTQAQDLGSLSPLFYTFNDRERVFRVVEAITGGRMHPSFFRIGGVAMDLPNGWDRLVREFLDYLPARLRDYDGIIRKNRLLRARLEGVGEFTRDEAIAWGATGPALRATGLAWDLRKERPYSGYERFAFDVPTADRNDGWGRLLVRVEEMRQSLRIVRQCLENMPAGTYKADHPLTTPPRRDRTMRDIETLIPHFLGVSWGPVVPAGETSARIEATKGHNSYTLISDGGVSAYRCRIRTPSFAHMQMLPLLCRGALVSDVLAILGAMDYVLADIDR